MKRIFSIILALSIVLTLAGCGYEQDVTVNTAEMKVDATTRTYLNETEYAQLNMFAGEETSEEMPTFLETTKDGKKYYYYEESQTISASECAGYNMQFDGDKFVVITGEGESMEEYEDLGIDATVEFSGTKVVFDTDVVKTNGNLQEDKRTVLYDMNSKLDIFYACLNEEALDNNDVKPSFTKKLTNKDGVAFASDGIISSVTINGKGAYTEIDKSGRIKAYFEKQGKQVLKVKFANDSEKEFTYVYDRTKPKVNVKANKTYKRNKKITFKDKNGIQKATLNGKKIKSGYKVKKAGKQKLVVTDKAGNKTTVKFKIRK